MRGERCVVPAWEEKEMASRRKEEASAPMTKIQSTIGSTQAYHGQNATHEARSINDVKYQCDLFLAVL